LKKQNNSNGAFALQIALSAALLSISAVLLASSFKATPATRGLSAPIQPVVAGDKDLMIAGGASAQTHSPADAPFTFGNTGSLNTARTDHTAFTGGDNRATIAGGGLTLAPLASAAWTGAINRFWATSTNWSPNTVPGSGDTATFNGAGNGNSDANSASSIANPDGYGDSDSHCYIHAYPNSYVYSDSDSYCNGNGDTNTNLNAEAYTNPKTRPDA
jgi:hypothetical protein